MLNNPKNILLITVGSSMLGFCLQVMLPYQINTSHGSLYNLSNEDALALKGQEVYQQEGCYYCHTLNARPFSWEMKRFSDFEKMGYFPEVSQQERYYDSPALMGSSRIGPDLSRVASKLDENKLRSLLNNKKTGTIGSSMHQYGYLFVENGELNAVALSWKIKMLMNAGMPYSDPFQKSVFPRLAEQTRGDALVAYLTGLGKKNAMFTGNFYK
jgi:cytochrome c oxidase cbb3-type subunit 2